MSMTIDEKVVEMRFDNKQFEQNVHTSLNTIGDLKKSLNFDDAIKGISNVASGVKNFSMDSMATAVMVVHDKFSALEIMAKRALENITDRAIATGERLVKSLSIDQVTAGWNKYEQKTSSVQTIMAATSKDWIGKEGQMEFVNEQLDKLNWYTDETSAGFMDMVNNIGKFTSSGVKLEDAVTAMQGIANWGYISGAGIAEQSRAMYNLSQALATGSVKLMDWKSIENANMATVEFKEMAIQAAVANGTIKDLGNGVYKTLKGTTVSAQQFNQTLAEGWFTSDVLMDTLKGYGDYTNALYEASEFTGMTATQLRHAADDYKNGTLDIAKISRETGQSVEDLAEMFNTLNSETFDLGRRSFAAAQEAKTLSEAIDATKDAVSTGWMNTAEIIFGDYEEAKKLWTSVSEELWDVFASGAEARNEMLEDWAEMGGREKMLQGIANIWSSIRNIMGAVKEAFRDIFPPMTAKRLVEISENILSISSKFRDMTQGSRMLSDGVVEINEQMEKLKSIVRGMASGLSIVLQAIKAVAGGFISLFKASTKGSGSMLDSLAKFTDAITNLNNYIKENKVFQNWVKKVVDTLTPFFTFVVKVIGATIKAIGQFPDVLKKSIDKFGTIGGIINAVFETIGRHIRRVMNMFPALQGASWNVWMVIKSIGEKAAGFVQTLVGRIKDAFIYIKEAFHRARADMMLWMSVDSWGSPLKRMLNGILDIVLNFLEYGLAAILRIFGKSEDDAFEIATKIRNAFSAILRPIINFVSGVIDFIIPRLPKILDAIKFTIGLIVEIVSNLFTLLSKLPGKISEIFQNLTGMKIGEAFDKLKNAASGMLEKIKEVFKGFRDVDTDAAGELSDKTTEKLSPLTTLMEGLKKFFGGVANVLKSFKPVFTTLVTLIGNGLSKIGGFLSNFFQNGGVNTTMDLIKGGLIIAILNKIRKFFSGGSEVFSSLKDVLGGVAGIVTNVSTIFKNLGGTLEAFNKQVRAKALLSIAIALGVLTLSLVVLAGMDGDQLKQSLGALAALFLMISASFKVIAGEKTSSKAAAAASTTIIAMGAAILLIAFAVKKLGKMDEKQLTQGLLAVGLIIVTLTKVVKSLATNKEDSQRMMKGVAGLIALAIAIRLLVKPIKNLGEMDPKVLGQGLLSIAAIMAVMTLFVKLTTANKDQSQKMMSVGFGLILLALAMKLIIGSIAKLGKMDPVQLLQGVGAITLLLLELGAFVGLMNKFAGGAKTAAIAASVVILATALLIIVGAVALMGHMDANKLSNGLLGIFVILTTISGALIALNKFTNAAALPVIAASLIIVASAMLVMAGAIAIMGHMNPGHLAGGLIAMLLMIGGITVALIALSKLTGTAKLPIIAASLAIVAAALVVLAVALKVLGRMSMGKVLTALTAIAGILVILGVASTALGPIAPALLAISGAVALLGVGIMALGVGLTLVAAAGVGAVTILGKLLDVLISSVVGAIPKLVEAATKALSAILRGAAEMLPDFIALVKALITGIIELIDPTKPDAVVPKLVTAVINLLDHILKEIAGHIGSITESLMKIVVDLIEGISSNQNLKKICDGLIKMLLDLLDSLIENMGPLVDKLAKVFVELLDGIGRNLNDIVGSLIDLLIDLLEALGDNLNKKGGRLASAIWSVVDGLLGLISEFIKAFFNKDDPSSGVFGLGVTIVDGLVAGIIAVASRIKEAGLELIRFLKMAIVDFLHPDSENSIWSIMFLFIDCIVAAIVAAFPKLVDAGVQIAYAIGQGLGDGMKVVDGFMTGWMNKLAGVEFLPGEDITDFSFGGFIKYLLSGGEDISGLYGEKEYTKAVSDKTVTAAMNLFTDERLASIDSVLKQSEVTSDLAKANAIAMNYSAQKEHEQKMNDSHAKFVEWWESQHPGQTYQYVYMGPKEVGESVYDTISGEAAKTAQNQQRFSMAEYAKGARYYK